MVFILLASVFFSEWMNMSIGMLVREGSILVVIFSVIGLLKQGLRESGKTGAMKKSRKFNGSIESSLQKWGVFFVLTINLKRNCFFCLKRQSLNFRYIFTSMPSTGVDS